MKLYQYRLALGLIFQMFFLSFGLNAQPLLFNFTFSTDHNGWTGDFADYPLGDETFYDLRWGWQNLPNFLPSINELLTKGMLLSGDNRSDDLFMFIKRPIDGLRPHTVYLLTFAVIIENNVPPGQFGIGGSPGESVFFKVGASTIEPHKVNEGGIYRLNVDKGNQSQGGKNAIVVGNLANPLVDPLDPIFQPKEFVSPAPLRIQTDEKGRLWLFVGTDSGFEGNSTYYVAQITVAAESVEGELSSDDFKGTIPLLNLINRVKQNKRSNLKKRIIIHRR